jgi:hypothetical protein
MVFFSLSPLGFKETGCHSRVIRGSFESAGSILLISSSPLGSKVLRVFSRLLGFKRIGLVLLNRWTCKKALVSFSGFTAFVSSLRLGFVFSGARYMQMANKKV